MNRKLRIISSGIFFSSLLLFNPTGTISADTGNINKLESELVEHEKALLDAELKADSAIVDGWEFRGIIGWIKGWFRRSEKKALDKLFEETDGIIRQEYNAVKQLESGIQQEVFNVAVNLEKNGEYRKAIEYYLKVSHKDDKVLVRIGFCHQKLGEFEEAVKWYLKMTPTDANFLHIVDCYQEFQRPQEALNWLFRILEPYHKNEAELKALVLVEEIEYPEKLKDFPTFFNRLSEIYIRKSLLYFKGEFQTAVADYRKAISLRVNAGHGMEVEVSQSIVRFFAEMVEQARLTLNEKREEAYEHYQHLLNKAEQEQRDANYRYHQALEKAERDYRWAIDRARRELSEAELALSKLKAAPETTPQTLSQAQARFDYAGRKLRELRNNKTSFIENEVWSERRQVEQANAEYNRLVRDRERIIDNYIAPYQRKLEKARDEHNMTQRLHNECF
jgi:tetratricopeptide (TPR) repeat protein